MFEIMEFSKNDEEKVLDLWKYVCIDEHGFHEWMSYLNETHSEEYMLFLVAKQEEKILGTIALSQIDDEIVELKRLYTAPEARGLGVAVSLMNTIFQYVKDNNFKKICLETYSRFERAVNFYNKNGFVLTDKIDEKIFFEKEIVDL